jgi:hypothetical protein
MYVKWGKAANTLWNQERKKHEFYEAEQVTAVIALVMTNIYDDDECIAKCTTTWKPFNKQILKINIKRLN